MDELKGRKKIYTDETRIDHTNVITVLADALITHSTNQNDIKFLLDYEKGMQPILSRVKEIRSEINIKIVENNAAKITDFKVGYEFGSPITYVQRAKNQVPSSDSDKDDLRITALNEMLYEESKSAKDVQLARDFKICGVGYRMIKAKKNVSGTSVFDILTLNPLTTFVVYSNDIYQKPMMACTYSIQKSGNTLYGCYTDDSYYLIDNGTRIVNGVKTEKDKWEVLNNKGVKNIPSIIPIVEYVNDYDRMGCFEKVIPILDAINITNSDRVNDIAQHVQSLLWLNNCELPEGEEIKSGGLIETKSTNAGTQASIKYLSDTLNQSEVQTLVDYLQRQAMEITGTPERQENGGGSTGSAMNLSSGWMTAEVIAKTSESVFEESEKQTIRIMLEIIKKSNDIPPEYEDLSNLKISDVMIRFSRNKIYDIATKVNALSTMLSSGIDALHAIETVSLFTNPQAVYTDSKDSIEEMRKSKKEVVSNKDPEKTLPDSSDQPQKTPFSG